MGNIIRPALVIERCILRSKYILMADSIKHLRKEMDYCLNRMPNQALTEKEHFPAFDGQMFILVKEMKMDIARYLKPLLNAKDIRIDNEFWFSSHDLINGYVEFSTQPMAKYGINDRVLLLSDVESESLTRGTIITWEKFEKISSLVEGVIESKTFPVHYALRKLSKKSK